MKGRVLVIEDDQDISLGIRTVLSRNGFKVASSADGKQGLRAFHVTPPDLVVLDIGLPTLDGRAVLERIRDLSDVPVLILTAHGNEADKVQGLHGGADDYLTKPFGNRELAARVEALLAPALSVVVVTAHAPAGVVAALLSHAGEYLEKPLRVDRLIATVTALIGQGRADLQG